MLGECPRLKGGTPPPGSLVHWPWGSMDTGGPRTGVGHDQQPCEMANVEMVLVCITEMHSSQVFPI